MYLVVLPILDGLLDIPMLFMDLLRTVVQHFYLILIRSTLMLVVIGIVLKEQDLHNFMVLQQLIECY